MLSSGEMVYAAALSNHMFSCSWIAEVSSLFVSVCIFSYEPEIHPAATYRIKNLRSTVQVFSTGSITVTGKSLTHLSLSINLSTVIRVLSGMYCKKSRQLKILLIQCLPSVCNDFSVNSHLFSAGLDRAHNRLLH